MTDNRSDDPELTRRHELPAEPTPPPVMRTSGDPEGYTPPAIGRPEWARQDAERLTRLGIDPAVVEADGAGARVAAMNLFDAWWKLAESRPA